jgi:sulfate adenylyltransferase
VKTLRESYPPRSKQGYVLFLTGLYNAGQDTIARALQVTLNEQGGRSVTLVLDNGERKFLSRGSNPENLPVLKFKDLKGATQVGKDLASIAFFTSELARAGAAVIVTSLTPKRKDQNQFLQTVLHRAGTGANVFHVHVATNLGYAEATDRRQVYARARRGELNGLPGVSVEYETPENPHLSVDIIAQGIPEIVHSKFSAHLFIDHPAPVLSDHLCPFFASGSGVVLLLEASSLV